MARRRKRSALSVDDKAELSMTPMIDISFLILIFFMCMPFKTLEGKLAAFLPTDKGIAPTPEEPPQQFTIQVHILARKNKKFTFGPDDALQKIERPTLVKYKWNQRVTDDIEEVGKWISDAQKEADTEMQVVGEIKAAHRVPHMFVVAVLNKFKEAGMKKVDFFGTKLPSPKLRKIVSSKRKLPYLPYPTSDY